MISLRPPSDADLDQLAARMARVGPTYDSRAGGRGYRTDEWSRPLRPDVRWEQAKDALACWGAHKSAGVRIRPSSPPFVGQTVALAIRLAIVHTLAACRVTATVDTDNEFGFTYATLPVHPAKGEESFVLHRSMDGSVTFVIRATSRASDLLARLGGPATRLVQRRIAKRYLDLDGLG